ncbi:pentapeptide repeat-containing protein [Streptomyces sp. NBC_00091]|uniref:pentapeptide repeat-containing protein n=1 Tax=Streptomyces sp. NBC_00091 TaxID=2975648 RepID=UPI00225415B4|nr:pentapeptide repeat-containing protein [Streptomyces sp. NBC_00091]MCX5375098.1 pentapeptide repeat-containing protein [Streptomyces sp. NBC_00091]
MIERLLAAFAEGAEDGAAPRTAVGAEEIADILWLAARVDPAAARSRTQGAQAAPPEPDADLPPPAPPAPAPGRTGPPATGGVQLFPAVHTPPGAHAAPGADPGGRRGVPLRLPRTASLDDPLALMRSLRPVGRRSIGGPGEELDEQLTVERSIEAMVPTPVLRPAESRWLDLALVVDTHPSMLLWSDLVAELRGVLTRSGVFRDVRSWQLTGTGRGGTPMLARGRGGPPRNPLELADPAGRRLILLVSDTVAGGWQEPPLRGILRHWSAHNAVAVLNVLPERLWTRGAVRPVPFAVRSDRPAAATRSWQRVPAARRARGGGPVVPVVGLASDSLARLVRVVSGDGRWRRLACLRLDAAPAPDTAAPRRDTTALEAVEQFRASASPTAQQLAAHLAAVPLTLPVMTLVRRSLLRDSEHGHLAEVALGGLLAPWEGQQRVEEAEFEFLPGVREVLLGSQLRGDVAAVRELVRRRVWEFMYRHRGTGPDFSATRVTTGTEGRRRVPDRVLPFAERPAADRGLGDLVVQVDFDPLVGPREVGVLVAPRLVLTAGDLPQARDAVAWIRSGGREIGCRPVWWDDASPRVLLLEAEEDLVDPAHFVAPAWGAGPDDAWTARLSVDGITDRGEPIALTGALLRDQGSANAELVRLSAEPGTWTHFVGGPVSFEGNLVGVVHTVRPDRMVFLTAEALFAQDGFRAALGGRVPGTGPGVALAVRAGEGPDPRGSSPGAELTYVLTSLVGSARVNAQPAGGRDEGTVRVSLPGPNALGAAGMLLDLLPGAMARFGEGRSEGLHPPLAVALVTGYPGNPDGDPERLLDHPVIARWLRMWTGGSEPAQRLLLALSQPMYEELRELLGPVALRALRPLGEGAGGWLHTGDPGVLAELLADAEAYRAEPYLWPRCGFDRSEESPSGCIGIRLEGHRRCLAHLSRPEQDAYLRTLRPGSSVDFRGTTFEGGLLGRVLDAVREPGTGRVTLGAVAFARACFEDGWEETGTSFLDGADFTRAVFKGPAHFLLAKFGADVSFDRAVFEEVAAFDGSTFLGTAGFSRAVFLRAAQFVRVTWADEISFERAVMEDEAVLDGMSVQGRADFGRAVFKGRVVLGESVFLEPVSFARVVCEGPLSALGTRFGGPSDFERLVCEGEAVFRSARFDGPATFSHAYFAGLAAFDMGWFEEPAIFASARFRGPVLVKNTECMGGVSFDDAVFEGMFRWVESRVKFAGTSFGRAVFHGPVRLLGAEFAGDTGFDGSVFNGPVTFESSDFRAGLSLAGATFHGPVALTDVTLAETLEYPGGWTATESDGVWEITSPDREEPADG